MNFTKMHGAGNDFIIINNMEENIPIESYNEIAARLCARRTAIGADGLLVVMPSDRADFRMAFFNSDGLEGEMCGNGARCMARYAYEHGLSGEIQNFETRAGIVTGWRIDESYYRIKLNSPTEIREDMDITVNGREYHLDYAELGDPGIPHVAVETEELEELTDEELISRGRSLRCDSHFPKGANINFYKIQDDGSVLEKTYERGVEDLTLACGTGSGTVAYFLVKRGRVEGNRVCIHVPGGTLYLEIVDGDKVYLEGPTCDVAEGKLFL